MGEGARVDSPAMTAPSSEYAKVWGSPGERARFTGLTRAAAPLFLVVGVAGYLLRAALPWPGLTPAATGFLFLALSAAVVWSLPFARRRVASYFKGARGEEWVAHELAFLPADCSVYHGVRLSSGGRTAGDADHVAVTPFAVILVETKNWSGRLAIDGERVLCNGAEPSRQPVAQALEAARELERTLAGRGCRVQVRPVVCFASGRLPQGPVEAGGATLCDVRALASVVKGFGGVSLPELDRGVIESCLQSLVE